MGSGKAYTSMSKGEEAPVRRTPWPCELAGARLWRFDVPGTDGDLYIPYFYNPALDPEARLMIVAGRHSGTEQLYILDIQREIITQLTDARGHNQHWSPYIREHVAGIRPQFIAWSQPDWRHVLYWEGNVLRRVHIHSFVDEPLFELAGDRVPSVLHCSAGGWVSWGYLPASLQERLRTGASVPDLEGELTSGCGFCVYDLNQRRLVLDDETAFWPNHVAASPDNRWVLFCHEGSWNEQRMYLHDVERADSRPLRVQDDGVRIGHEFWITPTVVGYHGTKDGQGFFGTINVDTGAFTERPSPDAGNLHYGHYYLSPDGRSIVTDGEVAADAISISPLDGRELEFQPVCRHSWARELDQRYHPHPHWHERGRFITFTGCERHQDGAVRTHPCMLELPDPGQQ